MPLSRRLGTMFCLLALLGAAAGAHAAGDADRGKRLAYTCLGCHGIEDYKNVYPTYSVPKLVGQHPEYIVAALKEYKSGERSHGTMHQQAASLSDQDMEDIAAYLAGPPLKSAGVTAGTAPAKVTQLCVACHQKDGISPSGDYPSLSGQHADYLARTLEEYKRGDRKNPVMATFVTQLSAEDMGAIAEYYSEQKPALETVLRRTWFLSSK
jgi:cytochrome c553